MTSTTIERVVVSFQVLTAGFKKGMQSAQTAMEGMRANAAAFGNVLRTPNEQLKKMPVAMSGVGSSGARLANSFRQLTHGARGFRMEMLGVMFFGMMMKQFFTGLLKPVMEAFGVFDLFRLLLLVLFIPVMEMLFEPMLKIMEFFMNLPEPVQLAIGVLVLLGIAFGALLQTIGSLALGIGSLLFAIGEIGPFLGPLAGIFSAAFAAILAIVLAVILGIIIAWQENFGQIREWTQVFFDGLKQTFSGALQIIKGIFSAIFALFKGDTQGFINALKAIWNGLKNLVFGLGKAILAGLVVIGLGIFKILFGVFNVFLDIMFLVLAKIVMAVGRISDAMLKILAPGIRFIIDMFDSLLATVESVLAAAAKFSDLAKSALDAVRSARVSLQATSESLAPENVAGSTAGTDLAQSIVTRFLTRDSAAGGTTVVNNNIQTTVEGFTTDDIESKLDERDRRIVDELTRNAAGGV